MSAAFNPDLSRRGFLRTLAGGAALASAGSWLARAETGPDASTAAASLPWFRRARRWGQVNLTEIDPTRFDLAWWRGQWRRTCLQGVVVNAGGIVAYYPTEVPFHRRARFLGQRDLFGEILHAAHEDGLAVFARMDSNRADENFYRAHPDWFGVDAAGTPYRVGDLYVACVNGPYYTQHIPAILREVAGRYRPEGFTDNNWNGLMRDQPCHCGNCAAQFLTRTGQPLPRAANWEDPVYRDWITWNYARRLEIWDEFNRVTRASGGPDCLWVGMMAGAQNWQARVFRDDREIYRRTELVMLDDQRRFDPEGFQHNAEIGQRIHAAGGWDKLVPESMAMYHLTEHNFRLAAKPPAEVRLWAIEGIAGGVQPWWHLVGSDQQDRRVLLNPGDLWRWHRDHEEFLVNRRPVATVGLLWSQRNMDFFGRDDGAVNVDEPWNGFLQALVRARIPYVPVHVDDVDRVSGELGLRLLILPNLGALSDPQLASIRAFAAAGGSILATGVSSLVTESGEPRPDLGLGELLGVKVPAAHPWRDAARRTAEARGWKQTYLRLAPEVRGARDGPLSGDEPAVAGERHPVLRGFEQTDILAFGGMLAPLDVAADVIVPLTFVPPVPVSPVESVWMPEPRTTIPALMLRELPRGGRVAYLAADLDRRFARENLPDHGDLLANLVRWAARDPLPVELTGAGLIDVHLYRQPGRLVLHLVNLTNAGTWRTPVHELIAVGPLQVRVRLDQGLRGDMRSLVAGLSPVAQRDGSWAKFEIASLLDHAVFVIT